MNPFNPRYFVESVHPPPDSKVCSKVSSKLCSKLGSMLGSKLCSKLCSTQPRVITNVLLSWLAISATFIVLCLLGTLCASPSMLIASSYPCRNMCTLVSTLPKSLLRFGFAESGSNDSI